VTETGVILVSNGQLNVLQRVALAQETARSMFWTKRGGGEVAYGGSPSVSAGLSGSKRKRRSCCYSLITEVAAARSQNITLEAA